MKKSVLLNKLESLSTENQIKTALFAAELVLPIYESYHPKDNRVREAIELGKKATAADYAAAAYAADYAAAAYAYATDAAADADAATAADYAATAYAADSVCSAIRAGAKKKTIMDFMTRLEDAAFERLGGEDK